MERVFDIEAVVVPVAVEASFIAPKGIDEAEARLAHGFDGDAERGERVKRGGGGEKVGEGSERRRAKSAERVGLREKPPACLPAHAEGAEGPQHREGGGGRIC